MMKLAGPLAVRSPGFGFLLSLSSSATAARMRSFMAGSSTLSRLVEVAAPLANSSFGSALASSSGEVLMNGEEANEMRGRHGWEVVGPPPF